MRACPNHRCRRTKATKHISCRSSCQREASALQLLLQLLLLSFLGSLHLLLKLPPLLHHLPRLLHHPPSLILILILIHLPRLHLRLRNLRNGQKVVQEQHSNAVCDSVPPKQPRIRQGDHRVACQCLLLLLSFLLVELCV